MTSPDSIAITSSEAVAAGRRVHFGFQNTYAQLPEPFFARVAPTVVARPALVKLNFAVAEKLSLDPSELASPEGVEILAGNRVADGSEPLAQAYAGHQYAHFVPQLGDGRAILLGEVMGRDGARYDIQLKGSGPTPYSRRGDGRAAVGPVLREYILSEAMDALGIPTTRSLAAVTTGEPVFRETVLPGAVLTRIASSHIRVGTFEYFAARRDTESVRTLADFAIARHYAQDALTGRPYRAFLDGVIARQARLIAQWMLVGFVHGVMNTDNMAISGETIDYGPCAFIEAYDPATVFSSIDRHGRYAYGNQPRIGLWNLTRLAEALLPVLEVEAGSAEAALASATEALEAFAPRYEEARLDGLRRKLGLLTARDGDGELAEDLLQRMTAGGADFTLTFRRLCNSAAGTEGDADTRALFSTPTAFDAWVGRWRLRLDEEPAPAEERANVMRQANPLFIPRNHLVEEALKGATEQQDYQPFEDLLKVVSRPFEEQPNAARYAAPARPEERVLYTFCGT